MANLAKIKKYLKSLKLPFEVIDLGDEIFTVKGVVESGVNEEEIIKTLIIHGNKGFVALVLRGKDRVDFKKIRKLFGPSTHSTGSVRASSGRSLSTSHSVKCELAKPEEVLRICKVPVGAVCPILLDIPVYFDKRVMSLSHINMGSGDLTKGLEMELADLLKSVGKYQIEDLVVS